MNVTVKKFGDFYEAFDDDAQRVADALELVVTKTRDGRRACGIPSWRLADDTAKLAAVGIELRVSE